jgi:hypothetical protein
MPVGSWARSKATFKNIVLGGAALVVLTGGTAYAANEWTGTNIVDGSLTGADLADGTVASTDIKNQSVTGTDLLDGSVLGSDIKDGTITTADVLDGTIRSADILNESIASVDIANGTITEGDINGGTLQNLGDADTLDGRTADDFGRTAVAAIISYNNGGTFAEQTRIVIDAPTDGLMLVMGSASINTLLGGDTTCDPCLGVIRLRDAVNGATGTEQVATFGDGSAEASAQLATNWVFPVEAGRRVFALDAIGAVPNKIFVDNPTVTALFVPFGPSGGGGAVAAETPPERHG